MPLMAESTIVPALDTREVPIANIIAEVLIKSGNVSLLICSFSKLLLVL